MLQEKNALKLKHLQKYFVPAGIDAKVILQAFKMQENKRLLSTCRSKQFAMEQKIEQQVSKLDLLQITGRQSVIPQSIRRPSHKKGIKDIRLVFDNPITRIVDVIAQDPDSRLYQRQLSELQRLSSSSSPKGENTGIKDLTSTKGIFSQKEIETPFLQKIHKHHSIESSRQDSMEYYEQLILNNPVLYRKIMMAYNASKRHLQQLDKKNPLKRETIYESKFNFRSNLPDSKNMTDKKSSSMLQLRQFQLTVCLTNRLLVYPQPDVQYRAFICKGNNGLLVKSILKTRPWWSMRTHSDIDTCNLIWTEWKKAKVVNRLPCRPPVTGPPSEKQPDLASHSKKRELVMLGEKKINNFKKIVCKGDPLWLKYEKMPHFQNYLKLTNKFSQNKLDQSARSAFQSQEYRHLQVQRQHKIHNHIPGCLQLHSKKLLFHNLKNYYDKQGKDIFSVIPLTFHIINGVEDVEFAKFTEQFEEGERQRGNKQGGNVWILKPGENSNRGNGISVSCSLSEIRSIVSQKCISDRTLILQKYVQNPFLYCRRKFDIRCYMLITSVNGIVKGYWYEQGYIRTASKEYNLKNLDNRFVHLTNDAVQKRGDDYGKFENFNKVSYADFDKYVEQCRIQSTENLDFDTTIQKMKKITTDLIESTAAKLNPKRKEYSFQIFGLDFMLDNRLNPFLIEANSNPCIEVDGSVLGRIIPAMIQNVIRVAIDPLFPPPLIQLSKNRYNLSSLFQSNKLILVYDSYFQQPKGIDFDQRQNEQQMEQDQGKE